MKPPEIMPPNAPIRPGLILGLYIFVSGIGVLAGWFFGLWGVLLHGFHERLSELDEVVSAVSGLLAAVFWLSYMDVARGMDRGSSRGGLLGFVAGMLSASLIHFIYFLINGETADQLIGSFLFGVFPFGGGVGWVTGRTCAWMVSDAWAFSQRKQKETREVDQQP